MTTRALYPRNHTSVGRMNDAAARAWLAQQGFQRDDVTSEIMINGKVPRCPMACACQNGRLDVCRWLFENGAAQDVSRPDSVGSNTPMLVACHGGHFAVAQWLYSVGAEDDIGRANSKGQTPMLQACCNGYLTRVRPSIVTSDWGGGTARLHRATLPLDGGCLRSWSTCIAEGRTSATLTRRESHRPI